MGIINTLMGGVKKLLGNETQLAPKDTGVRTNQKLWQNMYYDKAPWLTKNIKSLNLPAIVSAELSRLVTLEVISNIYAPEKANSDTPIDKVYQREVMADIRNQVEYGLAFGGLIIKPYISGGRARVDFAHPSDFTIVRADTDGAILEVFFKDYEDVGQKRLVRIEHHKFDEQSGGYLITNQVYKSNDKGDIGDRVSGSGLDLVERWSTIRPETQLVNIKAPLFGYFKPATSNNIDAKSPYGISIFAKAAGIIELADKQLSALVREYKVKEAKQYVSDLALKGQGIAESLPHLDDDFYIMLHSDDKEGQPFFEGYSPEIHVEEYLQGLNEYKRLIEDCIGLAHGTISPPQAVTRTATEIREHKQRTYVTITENQKALEKALKGAVYALAVWLHYPNAPPEYEVVTDFDDSILGDWETEMMGMAEDVASGYIRPEIYLAKKYGVSEEKALEMMPPLTTMLGNAKVPNDGGGE